MDWPVIKGASYILIHAPMLTRDQGTTQTMEMKKHPESEYLKKLPAYLRDFPAAVGYAPNQVYIGNLKPEGLTGIPSPWYENPLDAAKREGKFGEIMPEDEFYGLMKMVDTFDLVVLGKEFTHEVKRKLKKHPLISPEEIALLQEGAEEGELEGIVKDGGTPLYLGESLVGVVKSAHQTDINLSSHVMLENLAAKASAVLALKSLLGKVGIAADAIDYIIEASEEACGDMNQRGGGNFAKAIGEKCGCVNATGADMRSFCAGPTHALIAAAALVSSGVYRNIVVVAGGATAKLGMNGKDHVAKGMPVLEDMLGGFAILIGENDGKNPIIRTDLTGRHTVGTGSSPQAVIQSIVTDPLNRAGMKITDIDKYSVEMQNPEITKPAGAGDVPQANYKMIGALAVKRGEIERTALNQFITEHGMPGFAPTQGHIPSGIPYIGFAREGILQGEIRRAMIIGKGSLFLGRMTNLFDGVSLIMEANPGKTEDAASVNAKEEIKKVLAQALHKLAAEMEKE